MVIWKKLSSTHIIEIWYHIEKIHLVKLDELMSRLTNVENKVDDNLVNSTCPVLNKSVAIFVRK